eukprot:15436240-Alexandrium_andersonii.AAC.1
MQETREAERRRQPMAVDDPLPPLPPASGPVTPAPVAGGAAASPPLAEVASEALGTLPASDETVRRRLTFRGADFDLGEGGNHEEPPDAFPMANSMVAAVLARSTPEAPSDTPDPTRVSMASTAIE